MRFANLTDSTLCFDVRGKAFDVASGEECDIPERFAYVVKSRGLPLTPSADLEPESKPAVEPLPEPVIGVEPEAEHPKQRRRRF